MYSMYLPLSVRVSVWHAIALVLWRAESLETAVI